MNYLLTLRIRRPAKLNKKSYNMRRYVHGGTRSVGSSSTTDNIITNIRPDKYSVENLNCSLSDYNSQMLSFDLNL